MPAKKKTVLRAATPRRKAQSRLQQTWKETQAALSSAEGKVEQRVRELVKRSGVDTRQATKTLKAWRGRIDRERRKAVKEVEGRLSTLQVRAGKERRAVARLVDDTVQRTLAALNIPSRQEVHELTRRVEELSRKVGGFRR